MLEFFSTLLPQSSKARSTASQMHLSDPESVGMASFSTQSFSEPVLPFSSSFWTSVCLICFSFSGSLLSPYVSSFACSCFFSFSLDRFSPLLSFFSDSPLVFDSCLFFSSPKRFHVCV